MNPLIAKTYPKRGNKKGVEFYQIQMVELLKQRYELCYKIIDGKKLFTHLIEDKTKILRLGEIRRLFADIIRDEFEELNIKGEIEYIDFLNEYHRQQPIKIYTAREYFGQ